MKRSPLSARNLALIKKKSLEIDTNSRRLRLVGETERKPLYNATDFNYVRFDCAGWFYEMYNGELRKYYC